MFIVLKFDMETGLQRYIAFKINGKYAHTVETHLIVKSCQEQRKMEESKEKI